MRPLRAALAAVVLAVVPTVAHTGVAAADQTTAGYDTLRTGWDQAEPGLAPGSVASSDFGTLFTTQLRGALYATPLVTDSGGPAGSAEVIATTEADQVYGLDALTGAVRWQRDLGPAWPAATIGCGDLVPDVGSTSTPVLDPSTDTVYLTTKVNDGPDASHPHWYLHALDAASGAERSGFPTVIAGSAANNPAVPFDAEHMMQRPGLLLLDGVVYAAFGGHCDIGPYNGFVAGVSASTGAVTTLWTDEAVGRGDAGGIWQPGGLVSDGSGSIYLTTGNGNTPVAGPGTSMPATLGDAVVHLRVQPDGSLKAVDFFAPSNAEKLNGNDQDLGSGAPLAIPDGYGTSSHPHLMVQVGKDGRLFLLDRDHLGGLGQGPGGGDDVLEVVGPSAGVWGHPAFFGDGTNGYVYVTGSYSTVQVYRLTATAAGLPQLSAVATSQMSWGYTSGSAVITSNGTDPSSAVLWGVKADGPGGSNGTLEALAAVPANGVVPTLFSLPVGTAAKFSVPATDAGRVYVGTRTGMLYGVGRPAATDLTGPSTGFGSVPVGGQVTSTVTLTATRPVTVTALGTAGPFSASASLPAQLAAGATLPVTVTFSPTSPGAASGALTATDSAGATFSFGLSGYGTRTGLLPDPSSVAAGQVPVGADKRIGVTLTNTGTTNETVQSVQAPATGPFTVAGLPAPGTVLSPQASIALSVDFRPTTSGPVSDSITVTTADSTLNVPLSGTGAAGAAQLALSTDATGGVLDLGPVPVGSSASADLTLINQGNIVLTITKAAPPAAPFGTTGDLGEGRQVAPGRALHEAVSVSPTAAGPVTGSYTITGDDGSGPHVVTVRAVGVAPAAPAPAPPAPAPNPGGGTARFFGSASGTGGRWSGIAEDPATGGYWLVDRSGRVEAFGAPALGSLRLTPAAPVVGIAATADGRGYWLVGADGGVFAFGDAAYAGSLGALHLNAPIVAVVADPAGGYWLVAADGGVFAFGGAPFLGSTGALHLRAPVVGATASPDGLGYRMVAADGGLFSFGDAAFDGSWAGARHGAVVAMAPDAATGGYWLIDVGGVVAPFGAPPVAAMPAPAAPITASAATSDGGGLWLLGADGGVFCL